MKILPNIDSFKLHSESEYETAFLRDTMLLTNDKTRLIPWEIKSEQGGRYLDITLKKDDPIKDRPDMVHEFKEIEEALKAVMVGRDAGRIDNAIRLLELIRNNY